LHELRLLGREAELHRMKQMVNRMKQMVNRMKQMVNRMKQMVNRMKQMVNRLLKKGLRQREIAWDGEFSIFFRRGGVLFMGCE